MIRQLIRSTDLYFLFYIWENYDPTQGYHFWENVLFIPFTSCVIFLWGTYHLPNSRWSGSGEITPVLNSKKEPIIQEEGGIYKIFNIWNSIEVSHKQSSWQRQVLGGSLSAQQLENPAAPSSLAIVTGSGRVTRNKSSQRVELRLLEDS